MLGQTDQASAAAPKARCPRCKRHSATPGEGKNVFYCHDCRMYFSGEDDGDVGYSGPERIAQRHEEYKHRHQQRRRST